MDVLTAKDLNAWGSKLEDAAVFAKSAALLPYQGRCLANAHETERGRATALATQLAGILQHL